MMARTNRPYRASVPYKEFHDRQMQDPEYAKAYEELGPEFDLIAQVIALRTRRNVTQIELAERIGAPQSSISRLENRGYTRDLDFLRRLAQALGARLEIRLVPREEDPSRIQINLPRSLYDQLTQTAAREGTTVDIVIATAVAEKLASNKSLLFRERSS